MGVKAESVEQCHDNVWMQHLSEIVTQYDYMLRATRLSIQVKCLVMLKNYIKKDKPVFGVMRCSGPIMSLMPSGAQFPTLEERTCTLANDPTALDTDLATAEALELDILEEDLDIILKDAKKNPDGVLKRAIEDAETEMSTHSHAEQNLEKEEHVKQLIVLGRDKLKELEKEYVATEKQLEMLEETLKAAMNRPHGELKLAIEDAGEAVEEQKLK